MADLKTKSKVKPRRASFFCLFHSPSSQAVEAFQGGVAAVPFVDETAGNVPRPAVQVLVGAPASEVAPVGVQVQRYVPHCVREVPADHNSQSAGGGCDRSHLPQNTHGMRTYRKGRREKERSENYGNYHKFTIFIRK